MMSYENQLNEKLNTLPKNATTKQLYEAVSSAAMEQIARRWNEGAKEKRACYFSAEFLMGRMIYNNLLNAGLLEETKQVLAQRGVDIHRFEEVEDHALGNGGLGRLAACFLDSAATHGIPLDGYGIRYRYGLFKQHFDNGFQRETPDDWQVWGDPWSVRREDVTFTVSFGKDSVKAVAYDMPIIGYGGETINRLRLWQAEPLEGWFDFDAFNRQEYSAAMEKQNEAYALSAVLYPNDDTETGKRLRLRQQYFFSSASLQSILRDYVGVHGTDFGKFGDSYAIQLNDTHPVVSIPELLRLLMEEHGLSFEEAFDVVNKTFAYTNHTIMPEALEKWSEPLFASELPRVYAYVVYLQNHLRKVLGEKGVTEFDKYDILNGGMVHMARMAIFAGHTVNGVAKIHSELLKDKVLPEWYAVFPNRFQNKTNGISQRRWLALCNPELSALMTELIGDGWVTDLSQLEKLSAYANDKEVLSRFRQVKRVKKEQLCKLIAEKEGVQLSPDMMFDIQVKRLHEYKRQLLNAFVTLDTYFRLKDGELPEFTPTAVILGAKSAPGYVRAKGIIKFWNEIGKKINNDPAMENRLKVVFVQNYNVSYAESLIPAADVSEQISTAGTEASGTGNMKLMLNGAVTLGTMDGANIEIVQAAGAENNYIFGATVEELERIAPTYQPRALYLGFSDLRRVIDTLIDGTFSDGGRGMFRELYTGLLDGASWHKPDQYYLLQDFASYQAERLKVNGAYRDKEAFSRQCWNNISAAGIFSSDRTIAQYAEEIWKV